MNGGRGRRNDLRSGSREHGFGLSDRQPNRGGAGPADAERAVRAFGDSDAARTGAPLRHAQTAVFEEPFELERGGRLPSVTVAYETYGRLNDRRDNAVLICHALSGDSHVAAHDADDEPGWWDLAIGPGKAIDTDRFFVICPNVLGGCRGTTGPNSLSPGTGKPYGRDFPTITIGDMVVLQRRLLERLGIDGLLGVVGGSMGGLQVLDWMVRYPAAVRGAIVIASSARLSSQALAFDVVARNAILHDPGFRDGQYYDAAAGPDAGLAIARMIGHITYLSREAMQQKFDPQRTQPRDVPGEFEKRFAVGTYLGYQGSKFVERFDANSYLTLSTAMDLFDLGESAWDLAPRFQAVSGKTLVMSFTSDWLFPPHESRQIVDALALTGKPVTYCNIESPCGHDAFLLPADLPVHGGLICAFLANLAGDNSCCPPAPLDVPGAAGPNGSHSETSIFRHRLDYERIVDLISPEASVLDLGCGTGGLLAMLRERGNTVLRGVEISQDAVAECVRRGLDVIHADLNDGLPQYADRQFDCVVLSRTLQAVRDVERVMDELLRVGRRCMVTFPNFAYYKLRRMFAEDGRAPVSPGVLSYQWYDSPNIRFLSIDDFQAFCQAKGIEVHKRVALDTEADREVTDDPNRNADLAIFVLSR